MTADWQRFTGATHLPAAVALADQWQAEVMDTARDMAASQLAKEAIKLDQDEMDLIEAGAAIGYAAALVVLATNGWLRQP